MMAALFASRRHSAQRGSFGIVMNGLAVLGLAIAALPVVVILIMSFSGGTTLDFPPTSLSLRWYGAAIDVLFGDKSNGTMSAFSALGSSLAVGVATMLATVLVCVPLSYALVRSRGPWRQAAELLFTLPIVFPLVVLGVAYLLMTEAFSRETGVEPGLMRLAIPHITLALPFVLRNCLSAMSGVGIDLEEAAQSLGASPLRAILHVVVPLMKPGIMAGTIFAFIISFNEFTVSFFMYTIDVRTLPIWMYSRTVSSLDPTTLAISTLIIAIDVALIAWVDKLVAGKGSLF
ncbi:MAG: binding-protein-dependent transport system inner rane component [Rhodoferax sp.]|nr:binding-protein-dependent transport system inner rane component [Rhodoferax sp.]